MELRNSPLSRTPPSNLPVIPGITCNSKEKKQDAIPEEDTHGNEGVKTAAGMLNKLLPILSFPK